MKKIILSIIAVVMACSLVFGLVACKDPTDDGRRIYIAEAGSAGEEYAEPLVAKTEGATYVKAEAQKDVFTELLAKTADIGIVDSIMANYYIKTSSKSQYAKKLEIVELADADKETYAIGLRKADVYLTQKINKALYDLQEDGTIGDIASTYGLTDSLVAFEAPVVDETLDKSGYNYIINKGEFVVGYTLFAPIAYKDTNDNLIGFDTDVAKAVCQKLGVTAKFQEIDWDLKEVELNSKNIDAIWNGMTKTEERAASMSLSASYLKNTQVAVVRKGKASIVG